MKKLRMFMRPDRILLTDKKGNPRVVFGKLTNDNKPRTVEDVKNG